MKFLGFPKDIPDFTTVWNFREQSGWRRREKTERSIWAELQRQLDVLGLKVRYGKGSSRLRRLLPLILGRQGTRKRIRYAAWQRRKDAEEQGWLARGQRRKGNKSYFGFKLHSTVNWIPTLASYGRSKRLPRRCTTASQPGRPLQKRRSRVSRQGLPRRKGQGLLRSATMKRTGRSGSSAWHYG